jgi:hypothetical protein
MATITMTPELSAALLARLQGEYGQQALSNFALDILLDSANNEILRLAAASNLKDETIQALTERARGAEDALEQMKRKADKKRATVMGAADEVKRRQANGTNAHQ